MFSRSIEIEIGSFCNFWDFCTLVSLNYDTPPPSHLQFFLEKIQSTFLLIFTRPVHIFTNYTFQKERLLKRDW